MERRKGHGQMMPSASSPACSMNRSRLFGVIPMRSTR